ncbi:hypothetical protein [Paraburkholderia megapolitana]|uniref:Uncharacterized protein n=1 Tax=Paraburkholderia megapolitana TaxID=420953 RepID=A0A1I3LJL4_9BURK|nr:hypothetical protein [Paraburkholderia megapolitana]QDQ80743.1 hypothetical protein FNZ07_05925 [Paraburkholderia megapolitana]SFI84887.1 hypothetical protein SAMN05192543_104453 [Paraburkholderia megapolitana]
MSNRKPTGLVLVAAIAAVVAGTAAVLACGPDFPLQLLDHRAGTLRSTPANSFAYEASHLVSVNDALKAVEPASGNDSSPDAPDKTILTADQMKTVQVMRALNNGDAAFALGDGVPDAVRLYTAAAVDYKASNAAVPSCDLDAASAASAANAASATNTAGTTNAENAASTASAGNHSASAASHAVAASARSLTKRPASCRAAQKRAETDAAAAAVRAQQRFQAVLDLPHASGDLRVVWAAYMLGKMHADASTGAGNDTAAERAAAVQSFALARSRARDGARDPWGLAVASYGEEARLYLYSSETRCDDSDFDNRTACADGLAPADLNRAIALYAEQAARGSMSGQVSLIEIAGWALSSPARATRLIDDPLTQRLLVAYGLARLGDVVKDDPASTTDSFAMFSIDGRRGYADAARGDKGVRANPVLSALVVAIQKQGIERPVGADRLAALAYRLGRYDFAQTLIAHDDSALASWVRAKLALRNGDLAAAAQAYAQASKAFPPNDASLDSDRAALVKGEQGVLTLARGQYVDALDQLYAATLRKQQGTDLPDWSVGLDGSAIGYAEDAAYVAERVLTTDELKTWVDVHVAANTPAASATTGPINLTHDQYYDQWLAQHLRTPGDMLRTLLARRLVRDGRIDDALPYFPADNDPRFFDIDYRNDTFIVTPWRARTWAAAYGAALRDAQHAWRSTTRAEAWFTAATLARTHGMEIMGYEQEPDFATFEGTYSGGAGRRSAWLPAADSASGAAAPPLDTPAQRAAADLPGPFVTDGERQRYASSEAKPDTRFHYRSVAADEALNAANLLPPRSQAFAAVLCHGAAFVRDDDDRANAIYQRYVKDGAVVPFAAHFGRDCPAPDFRAASRFPYVQAWRTMRYWVHRHLYVPVVVVLLGIAGIGWWYRRNRARGAG